MKKFISFLTLFFAFTACLFADIAKQRKDALQLYTKGKYLESYKAYKKILDNTSDHFSGSDLNKAIQSLRRINRHKDTDALVEDTLKKRQKNYTVHREAAKYYLKAYHYGSIIDEKFIRQSYEGRRVSSLKRDRVRSLQLYQKAENLIQANDEYFHDILLGAFYQEYANAYFMHQQSFKLQVLTDISSLPDYEKNLYRYDYYGRTSTAPTDKEGNPIYYNIPKTFEAAKNDGERWRYLNSKAIQHYPQCKDPVIRDYANFLHQQFGVQTMHSYSWFGRKSNEDDSQEGLLSLHTLKENETTARLASGVKRFNMPDEHNFLLLHKELFQRKFTDGSALANIYLDRRQFKKAAAVLEESISRKNHHLKQQLHDITHDWAKFENINGSFPVGTHPKISLLYRNTKSVQLSVQKIDVEGIYQHSIKTLKSNPAKLDRSDYHWHSLSQNISNNKYKAFIGKNLSTSTIQLKPKKDHWDTRQQIEVPVKQAGAYLVTAILPDKKKVHTVVWIESLAVISKPVKDGTLYTVVDAKTGKPAAHATLDFFGYRQKWLNKKQNGRRYTVYTSSHQAKANALGQYLLKKTTLANGYNWSIKATSQNQTSYSPYSYIYPGYRNYSNHFKQHAFGITDRPVYQPEQKVYGKFWHRRAKYDSKEISHYAHRHFHLKIYDPLGQQLGKTLDLKADEYGGVNYEIDLAADCKLGTYQVVFYEGTRWKGQQTFRVEKYKKPEFEVSVESPKEPVKLGETFEATVKATYYHGAPVSNAKVKIKVMRHDHDAIWFPYGQWDWLYGSGYGWLGVERPFYPGWSSWGCKCPRPFWWPSSSQEPELVLDQEFDISPDGTVKVKIDSALAKEIHGEQNQRYSITAEVVDASRRTIVGSGSTLATAKPYNVTLWLDRGHVRVGEKITASIAAKTLDGKSVEAKGKTTLYKVSLDKNHKIQESKVAEWNTETDESGEANLLFTCDKAGQYKISTTLTNAKGHSITGATFITIRGDEETNENYAYNHLEITADKRTYSVGDTAELLIKTKKANSTVFLFLRGGESHQKIELQGQTAIVNVPITLADMPNIFVDAFTVSDAKIHSRVCELIVPPEKRVLNIEIVSDKKKYKPREKGTIKLKVTDIFGKPVVGSVALTIYDKALEYISGGSNVADIKSSYWKWRRHYYNYSRSSLSHFEANGKNKGQRDMKILGAFGHMTADIFAQELETLSGDFGESDGFGSGWDSGAGGGELLRKENRKGRMLEMAAPASAASDDLFSDEANVSSPENGVQTPQVMIRKEFADLVKWQGSLETDQNGMVEVPVEYPDNLTTWKIKTWAVSHGTKVGEGSAEVITSKDLIIRLQAPRFFVEKDEVTLSAVVHNYHNNPAQATVSLELEGGTLKSFSPLTQKVNLEAKNGEARIDWKAKVEREGEVTLRMKVITANDSDAMEQSFPVYVHGILKQEAWSSVILPEQNTTKVEFTIPEQRRPEQSKLEVRYSPTIAGSIISALPYLAEYPYGCTEQTLNRFVPTVTCLKLLKDLNINLEEVRNQQSNLNPQEIGDDKERLAQWKRWQRNPVFDEKTVAKMTHKGVQRLSTMQNSDGGWGWFSGYEERSYPHTTAVVVHGLLQAKQNGAKVPNKIIADGIQWLERYEAREVKKLKNAPSKTNPYKTSASHTDALVRLVLAENNKSNPEMLDFLDRDKKELSIYGKSLLGLALHYAKDEQRRDEVISLIEQFLVHDEENQTAYLNLRNGNYWWYWYGSEYESHAWYLKLLALTKPKSKQARGIVKYLVNNRKNATYWNSTRDTAYCIEAIAEYLKQSGEFQPEAEVEVYLDGTLYKTVKITKENLFSYDNAFTVQGDILSTGKHSVEIRRKGKGPLYTNTYLTVFTKEDFIKKAGLEVKVERRYYKLTPQKDATGVVAGSHGQVVNQKVEKYKRTPLKTGDQVSSGDLIEVELIIESKNDYEYLLFADWKPAGCENKDVRSGYIYNGLSAYMEIHDEKSAFFVRQLPRGKHSLNYQLRAEIPGKFSALPTQAEAMYAPELKANSDEMKLRIED